MRTAKPLVTAKRIGIAADVVEVHRNHADGRAIDVKPDVVLVRERGDFLHREDEAGRAGEVADLNDLRARRDEIANELEIGLGARWIRVEEQHLHAAELPYS